MAKFKVGDTVQLKSGGPAMTVAEVAGGHYWTSWFAGAKLEKGRFPEDALIPSAEDKEKK
jgi:uncharacterized protein YodC (DUF2158 family)